MTTTLYLIQSQMFQRDFCCNWIATKVLCIACLPYKSINDSDCRFLTSLILRIVSPKLRVSRFNAIDRRTREFIRLQLCNWISFNCWLLNSISSTFSFVNWREYWKETFNNLLWYFKCSNDNTMNRGDYRDTPSDIFSSRSPGQQIGKKLKEIRLILYLCIVNFSRCSIRGLTSVNISPLTTIQ